eukprot:CAMPEP_0117442566 /NCGR_PEP_ID=MMETSP0759-20121206/4221_1 /TAXON_ID=63605 /ORGANISM="Percolomonas cosmopolitus, Strain WS" /LENGTH=632 /DNA_ID=CAMNT_0005234465 /DNA_START=2511 /DNA_END=4409 /DNA_ORIENTATION=+
MAVIQLIASSVMIALSIAVSVVWLVYSSVFFWELFLATLLPGLFSFFVSILFIGLAVTEVSRYRYRKRFEDYVPNLNINMAADTAKQLKDQKKANSKTADLNGTSSTLNASDIDLQTVSDIDDEPVAVYKTDIGKFGRKNTQLNNLSRKGSSSSRTKQPSQKTPISLVNESDVPSELRIDWRRFMKKKGVAPSQQIYEEFLKTHERRSQASSRASTPGTVNHDNDIINSGRRIQPPIEVDSDDEAFGVFEDVNFEETPPKPSASSSKWDNVRGGMTLPKNKSDVSMNSDSSPLVMDIDLKKSKRNDHQSSPGGNSARGTHRSPSRSMLTQKSSRALIHQASSKGSLSTSRSARDLGHMTSRQRSEAKLSGKEQKRMEFERQQSAGKDWERFAKKERKRGREPTWEQFEKENIVVNSPFALTQGKPDTGGVQGANKIAMLSRLKMKFGSKLDHDEKEILQELCDKYSLPLKTVKQLHTQLVKKYGAVITRKQIKSSLNASKVSRNMLNSILRLADRNGDGNSVSVATWMRFMFRFRFGKVQEKFAAAFQLFDYDGSGELQFSELFSLVSAFASHEVSKAQKKSITARIFKQIDDDQSNSIDMQEFVSFGAEDINGVAADLEKMFTDFFKDFFV